ncbi:hypothetical protein [Phenylobacterium deserti]|uniref:hypothetical protein n=1 Tax=Phenylobacterium deserti TaxID=1914756 RepID=UPI001058131B|nr:hypothetical protein [Phenylobacterium deserti]
MIALLLVSNLLAAAPAPVAAPPLVGRVGGRVYTLPSPSRCPEGRLSHTLATDDLVFRSAREDAKVKKLADEPPATACLATGLRK